jgi:hypothetical protein
MNAIDGRFVPITFRVHHRPLITVPIFTHLPQSHLFPFTALLKAKIIYPVLYLTVLFASGPTSYSRLAKHDSDPEDGDSTLHSRCCKNLIFNLGGKARRKEITRKT